MRERCCTPEAKSQTESLGGSFPYRSLGYIWTGGEVDKSPVASSVCLSEVLVREPSCS